MTREEIIARLRKIAALASRGEGGEASNAAAILDTIAAQHGIDLSELDEEAIHSHTIPVGKEMWRRDLLCQIFWHKDPGIDCWPVATATRTTRTMRTTRKGAKTACGYRRRITAIRVECPDSVFIECTAQYEILARDYERQLKAFYRAFLIRNDLLCPADPSAPKASDEELQRNADADRLARGMFASSLHRQICD